jgi:hypothetical protein
MQQLAVSRMFDYGRDTATGRRFIVSEYAGGGDLSVMLQKVARQWTWVGLCFFIASYPFYSFFITQYQHYDANDYGQRE